MTSVVVERPISLYVFVSVFLTAWGDAFCLLLGLRHGYMICTVGTIYRLACRPTDSLIVLVVALFFRETPILAGGIGVARAMVGAVLAVCFVLEQL